MLGLKPSHSVSDLRAFLDSGFVETEGHASKFIQVLDESMCVVREDLTEWLQRYLFSSANATPIGPPFLLFRLGSGLWLSRLAYKLHLSVLQPCSAFNQPSGNKKAEYGFLRGAVSNQNLNTISKFSLPPFPHTLVMCAKLPLGPADTCALPLTDLPSGSVASSSVNSLSQSPLPSSQSVDSGSTDAVHLPRLRHADRWIARDNVSCFIQWCKDLGIPQTVLFETTGLVHRTEEKNVLLTLMELARIASRFGLTDLPELVRMEREIDALELERQRQTKLEAESYCSDSMDHSNSDRKQIRFNGDEITPNENSQHAVRNCDLVKHPYPSEYADSTAADDSGLDYTSSDMDDEIHSRSDKSVDGTTLFQKSRVTQSTCPSGDQQLAVGCTQTTPVQTLNSDSVSRKNTGTCCSQKPSDDSKTPIRRQSDPFVVEQVSKHLALCTCCNRLRMQRLEEGRYRLGNRVYYLRRFRNHVMVRVGGGWLTLDEFLNRHDPCRRGRDVAISRSRAQSPAPSLHEAVQETTMPEVRKPMLPVNDDVLSPAKLRRRWSKNSTSSSESHSSDHSLGSNISVRNRPHTGRLLSNPKLSVPHQTASKDDCKLQVASTPRASSLTCLPESTSTRTPPRSATPTTLKQLTSSTERLSTQTPTHKSGWKTPPRSATPTALKQLTSSTERLSTRTPTHTSVKKTSLGEPNSRMDSRSRVISTTPLNSSDTSANMPSKKTVQSFPQTGVRPPATNRQRDQISHTRGTSRPTVSAGVNTARSPRAARDKSEKRPSFRPVAS
ncbi:hypothetical protein EG68_02670 [Paragonimus skrjabini miyazakii]|uniref:GAR domain-containing protein n=1 Tax=Paragonimus skrjabini miyazakii TaxID=59628 RepID=A0A8S9Z3C5_9TREM|nr:hypothetical protein EG68_02670 [Paragonimus skrjabini miyazakii]